MSILPGQMLGDELVSVHKTPKTLTGPEVLVCWGRLAAGFCPDSRPRFDDQYMTSVRSAGPMSPQSGVGSCLRSERSAPQWSSL